MNIHEYANWLLLIYDSLCCRKNFESHLTFYIIQRMRCDLLFFQVFGNKTRPFNIHKYANEVICIFELHWKEQSLRFILVSILMFYDEQDLSYKRLTV